MFSFTVLLEYRSYENFYTFITMFINIYMWLSSRKEKRLKFIVVVENLWKMAACLTITVNICLRTSDLWPQNWQCRDTRLRLTPTNLNNITANIFSKCYSQDGKWRFELIPDQAVNIFPFALTISNFYVVLIFRILSNIYDGAFCENS